VPVEFSDDAAVTVVLASAGYPETSRSGDVIDGTDAAGGLDAVQVMHAGTARDADGRIVTAGGRVLAVTGIGESLASARERAYAGVALIRFAGSQHRTDIGSPALSTGA
jgi:phosphoribosylamine--glycine ligase